MIVWPKLFMARSRVLSELLCLDLASVKIDHVESLHIDRGAVLHYLTNVACNDISVHLSQCYWCGVLLSLVRSSPEDQKIFH